jgi:S-DNA-T family DNA segregation ATPase FtsK/SpoIIIE
MPRGCAADLLERTVREGRHRGLRVAVSGSPVDVRRLVPHCDERLVLAVADPHDDTALGVPRGLAAGREVPGRAVHVSSAGAVRCQVVLVGSPAGGHDRGTGDPGDRNPDPDLSGDRNPDPAPDPDVSQRAGLRLLPAPRRVVRTGLGTGERWLVPVGRGGDRALVVSVDAGRGVLVAGPAGSGRSTALATLALGLREQGLRTVVVASAGPLSLVGEGDPARHARTGAQAAALLRAHPADAVVIDDLDLLGRTGPDVDDLVAGWVAAAEAGDRDVPRVLGSARTDRAATAYRGAVAALRSSAGLLVLAPATPGSHDVAGQDLSLMVDPTDPRRPGYAALADRGSLTCVQVAVAEPP